MSKLNTLLKVADDCQDQKDVINKFRTVSATNLYNNLLIGALLDKAIELKVWKDNKNGIDTAKKWVETYTTVEVRSAYFSRQILKTMQVNDIPYKQVAKINWSNLRLVCPVIEKQPELKDELLEVAYNLKKSDLEKYLRELKGQSTETENNTVITGEGLTVENNTVTCKLL